MNSAHANGGGPDTGRPSVLELVGLARTYPSSPPVEALQPCDLAVHEGDWLAITGPSGSGKSTMLNQLGLLDRPSAGQLLIDGVDVSGFSDRDRTDARANAIGFVFQAFHLITHISATDNVEIGLLYQRVNRKQRRQRALAALEAVGLSHRCDAKPSTMSGGERQRVAIARALVREPRVLLCDEPTGSLDSNTALQILDLLDELNDAGLTIIVVTHDPVVAQRARSRIEIRDGVARYV